MIDQTFLLLRVGSSGFPYMANDPPRAIAADALEFMTQYNRPVASLHAAKREDGKLSWGEPLTIYRRPL